MRTLIGNLRFSLRMLRKSPGSTLAILLTLMLGIGATTAVYTVVYAALIAPLPYPDPQQLVIVWSTEHGHRNVLSVGDFLDWQQGNTVFQQLAAWDGGVFNLATPDQPEQIEGRLVTPGYFNMQGIPFRTGRDFLPEEGTPGKQHVVILTNKLWERLGARSGIIGQTLKVDGAPYTVVGVLAPGLADRLGPEMIVPLAFDPAQINHDSHFLLAMGRLKPGITLPQAQASMDTLAGHIAARYPKSNTGRGVRIDPLKNDFLPPDRIRNLWLLLGAVGFVLLITCINVANLLLAKGAARQKEIAVRSSMGATRRAIFAQFLTESLLLAFIGGALGIGLGAALLQLIVSLVPEGILPSEASFHLDLPVLLTALLATTLSGVLFGCAPAWYASRIDPAETLKETGRSSTNSAANKLRRGLIIGEFALALTLLAGAGLAIHSFWNLNHVDLGVHPEHVLTFSLVQPSTRFNSSAEMLVYNQRILESLGNAPGVSSAAGSSGLPLRGPGNSTGVDVVGGPIPSDPAQLSYAGFQTITPGYLNTYGIQLLRGRNFTDQDAASSVRVAIVNQAFVDRHLKNLDPLKQILSMQQFPELGPFVQWQIVGVTNTVVNGDFRGTYSEVDVPFAQSITPNLNYAVRTELDPTAMTRTITAAVHSVDPQIALSRIRTMDQVKTDSLGEDRFIMRLFASFAGVALLLAAVGIYGLMSYNVTQRTQEIGLRLALGAPRNGITALILREALLLAATGLGVGLIGALLIGRTMQSTLYGVGTLDVTVLLFVTLLLLGTALVASWLPAARASAVDPMQALRTE